MPLVSCIIPVFNGERYVAEAIISVLRQSHQELEILVIDDGSSDRTPEIVQSFGPPVHYDRQENAGGPAARNRGLGLMRGEFVAFLDADDRWDGDKLACQLARFAERL